MIGHIESCIIEAMRDTDNQWWAVVNQVVNHSKKNHASRTTQMMPVEAAQTENRAKVKTQLEILKRPTPPSTSGARR